MPALVLSAACASRTSSTIPDRALGDDASAHDACTEEVVVDAASEDRCEQDDYKACFRAAVPYIVCPQLHDVRHRGHLLRDLGLHGAEAACRERSTEACELLATSYLTGLLGIERDVEKASELLQSGCELGAADQCTLAGTIPWLTQREPTPADFYLLRRGCDLGDADGCDVLEAACDEGYSAAC